MSEISISFLKSVCSDCYENLKKQGIEFIPEDVYDFIIQKATFAKLAFQEKNRSKWTKYWRTVGGTYDSCSDRLASWGERDDVDTDAFCRDLRKFVIGQ